MAQHGSFTGRLFRNFVRLNMLRVLQSHLIFQSPSGWLNDEAPANIELIYVTLSTRQAPSGWLNA